MDISVSKFLAPYCDGRPGFCGYANDVSEYNSQMLETLQALNESAGISKVMRIFRDNLFGKGLSADRIEIPYGHQFGKAMVTRTWHAFNREVPRYIQVLKYNDTATEWEYEAFDEELSKKNNRETPFIKGLCQAGFTRDTLHCSIRFYKRSLLRAGGSVTMIIVTDQNRTYSIRDGYIYCPNGKMNHKPTWSEIHHLLKMSPSQLDSYDVVRPWQTREIACIGVVVLAALIAIAVWLRS